MIYVKIMLKHVDDSVRCLRQTLKGQQKGTQPRGMYKSQRPTHTIRDFKTETQQPSKDTNPTLEYNSATARPRSIPALSTPAREPTATRKYPKAPL